MRGCSRQSFPFVTETIYRNLTRSARDAGAKSVLKLGLDGAPTPESVHLTPYPAEQPQLVDAKLNAAMDFVLRAVSLGRAAREQARLKVRQPLATLWIVPLQSGQQLGELPGELRENLLSQIRDELNMKAVDLSETDPGRFATRQVRLNFAVLAKRLGAGMKTLAAAVKAGAYTLDGRGNLRAGDTLVTKDEFEIVLEPKGEVAVAQDHYTLVALDTRLTDELRLEGWAREVVRRIQDLRKQADYRVEDRIEIHYEVSRRPGARRGRGRRRRRAHPLRATWRLHPGGNAGGQTHARAQRRRGPRR